MTASSVATYESLLDIAGSVSRETFDRLVAFQTEFQKWSAHINLAAPSTLPFLWERHILDSAQLAPIAGEVDTWLDIGSGGGFPGAVMAILRADGIGSTHLVESAGKKAAFLKTTLNRLGVKAHVHSVRIEDASMIVPKANVVSARALARLDSLLSLAAPWLSTGGRGLFHKGRDYRAEVKETVHHWTYDLIEHRSRTETDSVILEIARVQRRQSS